jgi:hypothetical protein
VAGAAGTVAALAAQTSGVEPLGRPHDPAAVPVAGVEMAVWVAETMAALAAAPPGEEPQGRLLSEGMEVSAATHNAFVAACSRATPSSAAADVSQRGKGVQSRISCAAAPQLRQAAAQKPLHDSAEAELLEAAHGNRLE